MNLKKLFKALVMAITFLLIFASFVLLLLIFPIGFAILIAIAVFMAIVSFIYMEVL